MFSGIVVGYPTLQALSTLPSLLSLAVEVRIDRMNSVPTFANGFPSLESLTLQGNDKDIGKLVPAMASPTLHSLELFLSSEMDSERFRAWLASIQQSLYAELTELGLYPETFPPTAPPLALKELLEPMLSCRKLEALSCQFRNYPKDVTDDDVGALASAWPDLRSLWLIYNDESPEKPVPITLAGLTTVLQRCPKLTTISLPTLDVSALPLPETVPKMEQSCVDFLQINVYVGEETVNVLTLAVIIDRLFPRLKVPHTIKLKPKDSQALDDHLASRVEQYVAAIQAARRVRG
ncbi:hypothetical protein C8Q76DRAFT_200460 [Earliella scabrosa]|nr:hypothetical protein C8Q76DRAFT_200460 [Earliella scabrosa]